MYPEDAILRCYLENELYYYDDIDKDDDSCIDYKQWKTTDRSELVSLTETTSNFIHTQVNNFSQEQNLSSIAPNSNLLQSKQYPQMRFNVFHL